MIPTSPTIDHPLSSSTPLSSLSAEPPSSSSASVTLKQSGITSTSISTSTPIPSSSTSTSYPPSITVNPAVEDTDDFSEEDSEEDEFNDPEPESASTAEEVYEHAPPLATPSSSTSTATAAPALRTHRTIVVDTTANAIMTDGMAVRLSLVRRVLLSVREMRAAKVRSLVLVFFTMIAQIAVFSTILALTRHESCDKPLRIFLILSCARLGIALPLSFYSHLVPPRPNRRNSEEERAQTEANRRWGSFALDKRVKKLNDISLLFAFTIFMLGNVWYFSASTCKATSPRLWYTSLGALILSYLYVAEILLMIVAICFFLPIFLIGMRFFGLGEAKPEVGPATKADIEKLPLKVFAGVLPTPPEAPTTSTVPSSPSSPTQTSSTPIPPIPTSPPTSTPATPVQTQQKLRLFRLWRSRKSSGAKSSKGGGGGDLESGLAGGSNERVKLPSGMSWIELPDSQATCAVCLSDYDLPPLPSSPSASSWEPETLRLLPCNHCFHDQCITDWLVVSGRCPICQAPLEKKGGRRKSSSAGTGTGTDGRARGGGRGGAGGR